MDEFDLIGRYFRPLARTTDERIAAYELLDDAAFLAPAGRDLVLTTDMLVAGVHFFPEDPADFVARKALAVNVSDLIAKGARPLGYLLSLALPRHTDECWIEPFARGLEAAGRAYGCTLLGGDTVATPGPLTVNITLLGEAPAGGMVRRATAQPGDAVYVTGPIGDAALGLRLRQEDAAFAGAAVASADGDYLLARYLLPHPRLELVGLVATFAAAAMDVSDGLVGDFAKLCAASKVAGVIHAPAVPLSPAAQRLVAARPSLLATALTGGDDYVVLMCVRPERVAAFEAAAREKGAISCIGLIGEGEGVRVLDAHGAAMSFTHTSYNHFAK